MVHLLAYMLTAVHRSQMDLYRPSMTSIEDLVKSCEPATFGRGNENVYDESYRRAGKLSAGAFRPMFDVGGIGLVDFINERWLGNSRGEKMIYAELYNMNVYGECRPFSVV
jgi:hypothetical protein